MTTTDTDTVSAVILAGGMGTRFGGEVPKQLARLAGYPVLHHTLARFDSLGLTTIAVASNPNWREQIEAICDAALRRTSWVLVDGGETRNESIGNALGALPPTGRVLVHDGVRPLVDSDLVARVAGALLLHRAALPVIPSSDPLVIVDDQSTVIGFGDRRRILRGQSPQGFWLDDLRHAFDVCDKVDIAKLTTLFELVRTVMPELDIVCVDGSLENIKITMPVDHMIAGQILLGP